jgi:dynein heavy chain
MRNQCILNSFIKNAPQPVLFFGKSGTAKTATISSFLTSLDTETVTSKIINYSNRTTSMDVQLALEESFDIPTKDSFCPIESKSLVLFLDDVNMPTVDIYGTQQPISFLKLLVERGEMNDRGGDLIWKTLNKEINLGSRTSRAPPGGAPVLNFSEEIQHTYKTITDRTIKLYEEVVAKMSPTPAKFHYLFNLRDMSKIFESIC